jgi:hypothetical protein
MVKLRPEKNPNYVHPGSKKLKLTLFWTDFSNDGASKDVSGQLLARAKKMLKEHGLGLDVLPNSRTSEFILPYDGVYEEFPKDQSEKDAGKLRALAHSAYPHGNGRLPVIFVPFETPQATKGQTWGKPRTGPVDGVSWLTFLLINTRGLAPDRVTILHEAGHAANLDHNRGDVVNFMAKGINRTVMYENQVKKLAASYFCS